MSLSVNKIVGSIVVKPPQNVTTGDKVMVGIGAALTVPIWSGPVAIGLITSAFGAGCGGGSEPTPVDILKNDGSISLTPEGGVNPFENKDGGPAEDAIVPQDGVAVDAEEPPVVPLLPQNNPIQVTDDRYVDKYSDFSFYLVGGSGLKDLPLELEITANPTLIDPALPCVTGMINITEDASGNYLYDPNDDGNRLPVTFLSYTLKDKHSSGAADPVTDAPVNIETGALCGAASSGQPVVIPLPLDFNAQGDLDVALNFKLLIDSSQFGYNNFYDYRLSFVLRKSQ